MRIAVMGSGNGGCTVAADMVLQGHQVSIWDFEEFPTNINAMKEAGGIQATGDIKGFAKLEYAGFDLEKTLEGAEVVLVVGPAYSVENFAIAAKPHLKKGQIVCVCPSSGVGAITFKRALGVGLEDEDFVVGETSTLPYATRVSSPGKIDVYHKLTGGIYYAALPGKCGEKSFEKFGVLYPEASLGKSLLMTMLQTGNTIIHPAVTILNAGRIESTSGDFFFYEDGATPAAGKLMKALDDEKQMISDVLGIGLIRDDETKIAQGYSVEKSYENGYRTAPGFKGIKAQSTLDTRYMHEDIGFGLVFISKLAKQIGLKVPVVDAVILVGSIIVNRDYVGEKALTPETLGIDKMDVEEMKTLFAQK